MNTGGVSAKYTEPERSVDTGYTLPYLLKIRLHISRLFYISHYTTPLITVPLRQSSKVYFLFSHYLFKVKWLYRDIINFQVSRDTKLVLESSPIILTRPQNKIADAGETVLLNCVAFGEPEPTVGKLRSSNYFPKDFKDYL